MKTVQVHLIIGTTLVSYYEKHSLSYYLFRSTKSFVVLETNDFIQGNFLQKAKQYFSVRKNFLF